MLKKEESMLKKEERARFHFLNRASLQREGV
jgi:hypothetical protein